MTTLFLWHNHLIWPMQIGWQPGIGDPTFWGWLTVWVYFLAALVCWFRGRTAVAHPRLWYTQAAILLLLGIIKRFNLLSLLTALGRTLSFQQQWRDERHLVQFGLIGIIVLLTIILLAASLWHFRRLPGRYLLANVGTLLLLVFILIRATSLHAVDYFLSVSFAGLRMNWLIELGLLGLLLIAALYPTTSHPKADAISMPPS
jgi:hypothetical protein